MCNTKDNKDMNDYFHLACDATLKGMNQGTGGPFGATLTRNGQVVCAVGNTVLKDTDISGTLRWLLYVKRVRNWTL